MICQISDFADFIENEHDDDSDGDSDGDGDGDCNDVDYYVGNGKSINRISASIANGEAL